MSLNAVQGQQGGKDGERTRLFPAPATGYSNGQSASPTDIEQPSRYYTQRRWDSFCLRATFWLALSTVLVFVATKYVASVQ